MNTEPQKRNILVIDDDVSLGRVIFYELKQRGFTATTAQSGEEGLQLYQKQDFDAVLTDMRMEGKSGLDVLREVLAINPDEVVIIMTAYGTMDNAMKAVKIGAADYITKPFATDQLAFVIEKALRMKSLEESTANLRQQVLERSRFENLVGESKAMEEVFKTAEKVALSDAPVLVLGETGTGKEELAKAIHHNGYRSEEPFVPVNCGSIPENLIESELFGHEKGAFTGADRRHIGSFEQANGGTVFLDEIAELPLQVQVKLLRVLQEHQIQRVGGEQIIDLDIRIIAATNQDLREMVENGTFREDLYYRLNVVSITMPPLRNRNGDIDMLAEHFLIELSEGQQVRLSDEVYELFHRYPFPGNVRELRNAIQRALVMNDGEEIQVDDLPSHIRNQQDDTSDKQLDLHNMTLEEIERSAIMQALEQTGGNQTQAAKRLGIPRHVLIYRLKKYDIEV
ncbi:MAG: sigma-54 dependent transcriptional regulator [Candidatus Marinimicrobia bacterium]|nr:sigma-54 dependent transcriptional regulator [Candidatus Neomarinimicrobiota bacterium]MCF7830333.1 sigma-54 dependent transcriptional regulator [Candidatus Neomarinimicrobiota bacterium]MCF7882402.1 sigma-54 dependent transcriptional regulator [Candidatus Neomarinimicrobiota bacterium]